MNVSVCLFIVLLHPIQDVFPPHFQFSQDRLLHDLEQDKITPFRHVPGHVACFVPSTLCASAYVSPCAFVLVLSPPLSRDWSVTYRVHLFRISSWLLCLFITRCAFVPCEVSCFCLFSNTACQIFGSNKYFII